MDVGTEGQGWWRLSYTIFLLDNLSAFVIRKLEESLDVKERGCKEEARIKVVAPERMEK